MHNSRVGDTDCRSHDPKSGLLIAARIRSSQPHHIKIRLARRRDRERRVTAVAVLAACGTGDLVHLTVTFADRGSEALTQTLGRLSEVVAALGCSLGKRRIRKVRLVANPRPLLLNFNLDVPGSPP